MNFMKPKYKILIAGCLLLLFSCKKSFLEKEPLGPTSDLTLANKAGVEGLLKGAYSMLDGWGGPDLGGGPYSEAVSNWSFGEVGADNAHKGSTDNDQSSIARMEDHTIEPTNSYLNGKWGALYTGVQRANDVIRELALVTDGSITDEESSEIRAEAIFLRSVYLFEAAKIWGNVPYVDETITYSDGNYDVPNTEPIWPLLEKDFQRAIDSLPSTQSDAGRANSWAAKAFLGKVYMFEHKFPEAVSIFTDVISNGVTASGEKYALLPNYTDNFNPADKNNSESVFAVQMTVQDGSTAQNGNPGDILNFPVGGPTTCCGFYQPSFSLVNSYKTDASTGLPLLDTWNESNITNDQGISSTEPFTPYTGSLDPRLDFTVGRRGIPFFDFGIMSGQSWIRAQAQGGPYIYKKDVVSKTQQSTFNDIAFGWGVNQASAINYLMIRFADVLLMAAEANVEAGNLDQAENYVNEVRNRAANSQYWVHTYIDDADPSKGFTNAPAADYNIKPYPAGYFAQQGQTYARKAVRFERRLELAMEGHRFFDLQRWDNGTGYMADVLNDYIQHERNVPGLISNILNGAEFVKGKNEVYPIPQRQIDLSVHEGQPTLVQNPGY
jgi:hypothetical protein